MDTLLFPPSLLGTAAVLAGGRSSAQGRRGKIAAVRKENDRAFRLENNRGSAAEEACESEEYSTYGCFAFEDPGIRRGHTVPYHNSLLLIL